ncbi:hypothetical protein FGG08_002555 [Glutinoglossum americanum]|uniref:ATPase AAA-type core domain-containing protein n=1 Tax=Glutinoglossum americanum TaxID=1670608 RepID=A0A9P8IEZ5_9PEZI|nr:hypothetical protein FGG08_002555 [Glutinoglossum americanum]
MEAPSPRRINPPNSEAGGGASQHSRTLEGEPNSQLPTSSTNHDIPSPEDSLTPGNTSKGGRGEPHLIGEPATGPGMSPSEPSPTNSLRGPPSSKDLPQSNMNKSSPVSKNPPGIYADPDTTAHDAGLGKHANPTPPNFSNSPRPESPAKLHTRPQSPSVESITPVSDVADPDTGSEPGSEPDSESDPESGPDPEPGPPPRPEQWDFKLPIIELDETEDNRFPDEGAAPGPFSIEKVINGLQNGLTNARLKTYLSYYNGQPAALASYLNAEVEDYPAIFYAVATNDEAIVRTWADHGGDVNVIEDNYNIPLLAFAILTTEHCDEDTTDVLTALLSLGADASVIPNAFFTPYLTDLPAKGPTRESLTDIDDDKRDWCKDYIRPKLAAALNLSQRYFLDKTLRTEQPSFRHRWVAKRNNSTAMLGISYFLIGQPTAAGWLIERLLSYMVLPKKRPLVLVFAGTLPLNPPSLSIYLHVNRRTLAGPSGHGKTELAKRLGDLLSIQMERVDMTEMRSETDIFGPKAPYVGSEEGSPLNNFLVHMGGQKSIVFLDEFEKSGPGVRNALLIPFDEVDCSKTIWILATNALDRRIKSFCDTHDKELSSTEDHGKIKKVVKALQKKLKPALSDEFGHPLAGRINAILPFLPFSLGEQAVVAHKFVLQLARSVRAPVKIPKNPSEAENLLGNIDLIVRRDASLCLQLAKDEYSPDLGARSLQNGVDETVVQPLVMAYLGLNDEICEDGEAEKFEFDVQPDGEIVAYRSRGR